METNSSLRCSEEFLSTVSTVQHRIVFMLLMRSTFPESLRSLLEKGILAECSVEAVDMEDGFPTLAM